MAEDIVKSSEEFVDNLEEGEKRAKGIADQFERAKAAMSQFLGGGALGGVPNPMGGQVNASSGSGGGSSFKTMNGDSVNVGSDGFSRGLNARKGDYKRDPASLLPLIGGIGEAAVGVAKAAAMALPDPNEAIYSELTSSRLKFYSGINNSQAEARKLMFSKLGTPTDALDAAYASNLGADVGLLPGLSNYYPSTSSATQRYAGVMGGAALASNLTPGLGMQGGMAVMGSMNQARRVNMLRMIGVNVRGIGGTNMRDLPSIISRIYELLKNANGGKHPTQQEIAESAMSGNALDSLLNQYFGDDENLRQVVIAGLMQMVNTKGGNLNKYGTPEALTKTGGMTATAGSLGVRSSRELELIQSFDQYTTKGIRGANDILYNTYGALMAGGENLGFIRGGATAMGFAETFGGARNGAGAVLATELLNPLGDAFASLGPKFGPGGNMILKAIAGAGILLGLEGLDRLDFGNTYNYDLPKYKSTPRSGVTLNVFSNSADPSQIGTAINTATLAELSRRS